MTHSEQSAVWGQHAKQWAHVGPPLKPSPEDGRFTLASIEREFQDGHGPWRVAILGVTPELVQLTWPASVELSAYDHSAHMIASVWQRHPAVSSTVTQTDWRCLPVDAGIFRAVVGDGIFNVLPDLGDYDAILKEMHRVLATDACAVIRCFVRPESMETMSEVVTAVNLGQVGSFHALKWRIAMSLADAPGASVAVAAIFKAFETGFPSRTALAKVTGWPEAVIDTIDAYKSVPTRYSFPTLSKICEKVQPYFDVEAVMVGSYELANRCPTLTLRRRKTEADAV